jgi:hypothetical protein
MPLKGSRGNLSPFFRVAAILLVLASAGLLVYQFAFNLKKDTGLAEKTPAAREEIRAATTDTGANVKNTTAQSGLTSTAEEKNKAKSDATAPAGLADEDGTLPASTNKDIAGEKANETPVATAPARPTETAAVPESAAGKGAEKEMVREEVKTRAAVAKKQDTDNNLSRDRAYQQPDDSRNRRAVPAGNQADDQYYRNRPMNTFRGRVTDASNTGLPFANVTNTEDNVGTYTDAYGNFVLTSPDSVLNVQIRSLGYDNSNILLRNDVASNKVVMKEDRSNLSEVVISSQKPNATARSKDSNRKLIEPEPADGWEKYDSYLANNLNTPEDFKQQKTNTDNSVQLSFEVDKSGEPVNIRIEKSLCSSCDKEAIRLVKEGPKWKRNANKKGRTTVTIQF